MTYVSREFYLIVFYVCLCASYRASSVVAIRQYRVDGSNLFHESYVDQRYKREK